MSTSKRRRRAVQSADTLRIRDFELLIALHDAGNLSQAAERVGITEPAASKQIKAIHHRMKVPLYDSEAKGDKLTAAAHTLLSAAVDVVLAYHRGMHDVHEALHGGQHTLRIGAFSLLPERWHRLLDSVEMRLHRNVRVHLDFAYTEQLILGLQSRDLDLALVTSPPQNGKLTTRRLETRPFMVAFREGHALAKRQSLTLSEARLYPWFFFHRSVHPWMHDMILRRADLAGGGVRIVHRVNNAAHVQRLLTDDSLLAWVSPIGAENIARPGCVAKPLDDSEIRLETHVAVLASNTSPLIAEYYKSFLKRVEEEQGPVQLTLPMPLPDQDGAGHREILAATA